jgi:flagellar basal body-associated protein FliL
MPTNLPDPQRRKEQESRDKLLRVILVFVGIALLIAVAMIVWWRAR